MRRSKDRAGRHFGIKNQQEKGEIAARWFSVNMKLELLRENSKGKKGSALGALTLLKLSQVSPRTGIEECTQCKVLQSLLCSDDPSPSLRSMR